MIFSRLLLKISIGAALIVAPSASFAQISIQVGFAPPMLPIYAQPICPGDGYLWTPGYWAYGPEGYFWIPGTWVMAPERGYLWTPAYWGFDDGFYDFHHGYWGPHIGFYGGINYGFGYFGTGFDGGEWRGNRYFYNTRVGNFGGAHVTNVYEHNVTVVNNNYSRVSFNGGNGGVRDRPRPQELQAEREHHIDPTLVQQQHFQAAERDRGQLANVNGGRPQVQAARTPQEFTNRVNTLPQQQRVAPGAPGERFHPNAQTGAQTGVQTGVQPHDQMRQPNSSAPQNRMQPVVPQQQRINNQPQGQPPQQNQQRQRPEGQPQQQSQQPQGQPQQQNQPRQQPQQPRQQMQPPAQPQLQPRQQPQPRQQMQPQAERQQQQPRQQAQPQQQAQPPQQQQHPQQNEHPREPR